MGGVPWIPGVSYGVVEGAAVGGREAREGVAGEGCENRPHYGGEVFSLVGFGVATRSSKCCVYSQPSTIRLHF